MKRHTLRNFILLALVSLMACCGLVLGGLFLVLHSPSLLNRLANIFSFEVSAQRIYFSPNLSGSISGLSIRSLPHDGLTLVASNVTVKNSLDLILQGEVDSLVLQNPKLTYRISKQAGAPFDLSFLKKLPNIRLLDIRNAEALFPFEGGQERVELTGINLTIKNFSSRTGGSIAFQANFALISGGDTAIAANGRINGTIRLTGVYPRPYGRGTVELTVDSGKYTTGNRTMALSGLTLTTDMVYDQRTETFAITTLHGESKNFGTIGGMATAVLRGEMPWSATCSVASIDFAQVFGVIKPLLPEEYHAWTLQGKGMVEAQLQGTYANDQPSLKGSVTFSFNQGGFNSPDSTRAAQGVTGKIVLKLQYAAPEQKLTFGIRSEQADGEYLWGKFYTNLSGQKATLAADGILFVDSDPEFDLNGSLDFFQTGEYSFSADGKTSNWGAQVKVTDLSHEALLEKFLKDYLKDLSSGLANLLITGTSSLEIAIRHDHAATSIAGRYRMDGATFDAPNMPLAIQEIAVDLPFDLVSPASGTNISSSPLQPGFIRFKSVQRKRLTIDSLQIPLTVARNTLEIPEPVVVPFYGGHVHLYGVRVDDVLSPVHNHFGVKIESVDLGRMTRRLIGTEYPGTINADLGTMQYKNNRIASEGSAVVHVFGGEIEATNFFAENIESSSRKFGGDISFRNINLEEVTQKIAIGKMTGIIQGSLKNLIVEYGQPASFTLAVESVEASGITQRISMDAIQNISILGTGAGNALNRGIAQFFREYPYRKIGFRCVLNNDQFSVNGTIHEGGKEYLVRRGFLRGVDVVNQNPDNVISFRDMQERIQRIFQPAQGEPIGVELK